MPLSAVKPEQYEELLAAKVTRVSKLLAPFDAPPAAVYPSPVTGFRMRAEFRLWHDGDNLDYVMFRREDPKTPVPIRDFPIACETIQRLMPALLDAVKPNQQLRRKLFQVEFLATLAGESLLTLVYHRKLDEDWDAAAEQLRCALAPLCSGVSIIGRSRRQKRILGRDWVWEELDIDGRSYRYQQYEQAFTQPNARVNIDMIRWACRQAAALDGDLLELYCGNGNFTLPLAAEFTRVVATELAKVSVRAARENMRENGVDNIQIIRLAAEEVTQAMNREREFRRLADLPKPLHEYDLRTVFVDPPRAGLDAHTVQMVKRFDSIIYISCNPDTLAENLAVLDATHRVEQFALFDQFPYTDHMECGVLLRRRTG
ncbi:tRNA (uridine(54)-C5)-methyltransferase TrmA [Seongchinamella sediminis]|uniref:tRNA/tmRNA (uracil-C(5))-methyltransferase n=1 Tax=Seongchinamella sediminis TaxID=2283635 RepID=A0A3L7E0N8_9GAMM|nr:tRNA (uridine(54)-C5)-methyltransferase TrmA [Seongchinamella sediminis]RLQ23064.1 tRNA (uridine(54)-C5)-methyltransferase TrmA [Seongchinamella sediminis]